MAEFNPALQQFVGQNIWVKVKFYYSASITEIYYVNILDVDYNYQKVDFLFIEDYKMNAIIQCATMCQGDYNELCGEVDWVSIAPISAFDDYELIIPVELYTHEDVLECLANCEVYED